MRTGPTLARVVYGMLACRCTIVAMVLFSTLAGPAYGFGADAHEAICEIAYRELTPHARERVDALIAIETDTRIHTFRDGCVWPDFRETATNARRVEHYINIPRDWEHIWSQRCYDVERCLFTAIAEDVAVLWSDMASPQEKLMALKFLGHWIGDIHQPLHVSFADDRGGNEVLVENVSGCSRNGETKLHAVWDSCIPADIMQERHASAVAPDDDDRGAFGTLLLEEITEIERVEWSHTGSPLDWANESLAIARQPDVGYCVIDGTRCNYAADRQTYGRNTDKRVFMPAGDYEDQFGGLVARRMKMAGVRLGTLLNRLFGF